MILALIFGVASKSIFHHLGVIGKNRSMKPHVSPCSRISVGFLFLLVTLSPWASASTSGTVHALVIQFDKIRASVISTIESLPDHPDFLESGSLDATLQTAISGDLDNLQNQLQQQSLIIEGKRKSVESTTSLSSSDKEDLKATLNRDLKPLQVWQMPCPG